jgi:hypothetical protein
LQHCLEIVDGEAARSMRLTIKAGKAWNEGSEAANDTDLPVAREHRRSFDWANELNKSRKTAADRVGRLVIAIRPAFAEPRERRNGETRI